MGQLIAALLRGLASYRATMVFQTIKTVGSGVAREIAKTYAKRALPSSGRRLAMLKTYFGSRPLPKALVTSLGTTALSEATLVALDELVSEIIAFYDTQPEADIDELCDALFDKYAQGDNLSELVSRVTGELGEVDVIDVLSYAATVVATLMVSRRTALKRAKLGGVDAKQVKMPTGPIRGTDLIVSGSGNRIVLSNKYGSYHLDDLERNPVFYAYAILGSIGASAAVSEVVDGVDTVNTTAEIIGRVRDKIQTVDGHKMAHVDDYEPHGKQRSKDRKNAILGELGDTLSASLLRSPIDSRFIMLRDRLDADGVTEISEYAS